MAKKKKVEELLDIQSLQEAIEDAIDETEIQWFAETEQLFSRQAKVFRKLAMWAYEHRQSRRAIAIGTFNWGFSAGNMARAVTRRKDWFEKNRATVTQMRMLCVLGQLDAWADKKFFAYWQEHPTLQPWEMQRIVTAWKKRKSKPSTKIVKMRAQAIHTSTQSERGSVELFTKDKEAVKNIAEGAEYNVRLSPDSPKRGKQNDDSP